MIEVPVGRIVDEIVGRGAETVLIQAPEGIKNALSKEVSKIQAETGSRIILHGDACFGACDLALAEADRVGADLLLHIGHTPCPGRGGGGGVVYVDAFDEALLSEATMQEIWDLVEDETVGLVASIQYLKLLHDLWETLKERGGRVVMGRPNPGTLRLGQILGCDVSAAENIAGEVDGFIVVGGGGFHGLGVALSTGKRTWVADPYREGLLDTSSLVRRKLALIAARIDEASRAESFGVIVGLKDGQTRMGEAENLVEELRMVGKDVLEIALREVSPERLRCYGWIECFVQTLCPRISVDDLEAYGVPLLSHEQCLIMMGRKSFEEVYPCEG